MSKKRGVILFGIIVILALGVTAAVVIGWPDDEGPDDYQVQLPTEEERSTLASLTGETLERFASADALQRYVSATGEIQRALNERNTTDVDYLEMAEEVQAAPSAPAPAEPAAAGADESITNVQEIGIDEGGIVKTHGDHLVVLRRGRLFSILLGDASMTPLSMIDAPPPGSPGGYYDEMLIHGDTVVVIGYNFHQVGTELGFFNIDTQGMLTRRATYYLRSNDYYSSSNYASRLLGDRLIFYMPYSFLETVNDGDQTRYTTSFPALRRGEEEWGSVISATQIYRPIQAALHPVMHVIVSCDLAAPQLACTAEGVVGPAGRSFYVSASAVYVWVMNDISALEGVEPGSAVGSVVYRLPLDGSTPGALRAWGAPTDQFSFKEADGHLNVLVRAEAAGDAMWSAEIGEGDVALLRVPLAAMSDGVVDAQPSQYTALPRPAGEGQVLLTPVGYAFTNRFVGHHVLYGYGQGWFGRDQDGNGTLYLHDYEGRTTSQLTFNHGVDRVEVMERHAIVIGAGGDGLHFETVELDAEPSVIAHFLQPGSSEGETRSHGFFYRSSGDDEGTLGLPVRGASTPGYAQLSEGSAGILFLHSRAGALSPLGMLRSSGEPDDDHCIASCADWYGNARPIFYRGRVFALLGYELVEGRLEGPAISEVGRVNFFSGQPQI